MKRALITGSDGFVGSHMVKHLRTAGWDIQGIDLNLGLDVMHAVKYERNPYDLVVHAAAAGPNRKAIDTQLGNFPYNVMLDSAMFEWAIRTKPGKFVYLSSCAVYSPHLEEVTRRQRFHEERGHDDECFDVYGVTKRIGEVMADQARTAGVDVLTVRPFSGYGEDQSADFPFRAFVERAKAGQDPFVIWGNWNTTRDWIHIDDICRAIIAMVKWGTITDPVNLCTGIPTTFKHLMELVTQAAGYKPDVYEDADQPGGMPWRVGDPNYLHNFYVPEITIEQGVNRAFQL